MLQIRPSKNEFRSSDAHFLILGIFGGFRCPHSTCGVPTAHLVSPQHMWCGCTRLWFSPTTCVLWTHVQFGNNCKHGYWRNRLRTIFRCLPTASPWKTGASIFLDLIFDLQKLRMDIGSGPWAWPGLWLHFYSVLWACLDVFRALKAPAL